MKNNSVGPPSLKDLNGDLQRIRHTHRHLGLDPPDPPNFRAQRIKTKVS